MCVLIVLFSVIWKSLFTVSLNNNWLLTKQISCGFYCLTPNKKYLQQVFFLSMDQATTLVKFSQYWMLYLKLRYSFMAKKNTLDLKDLHYSSSGIYLPTWQHHLRICENETAPRIHITAYHKDWKQVAWFCTVKNNMSKANHILMLVAFHLFIKSVELRMLLLWTPSQM